MKKYLTLTFLLGALWLTGCSKDNETIPPPVDEDPKTFILYGNLGADYAKNIAAAGKAVASGALIKGQRMLVYQERSTGNVIYELVIDKGARAGYREEVLKTYGRGEIITMNPDDMRRVLTDMRELAPANHYGLALGVHATGWLPKGLGLSGRAAAAGAEEPWNIRENPLTRHLGAGTNPSQKMDISEFAAAMDGLKWDFILFDACFMASVEALYEMRGTAPYIIASPAEILIEGFPYERVVSLLFDNWQDLESVARAYVSYYRGLNSYATVSLIKTAELDDLASAVGDIIRNGVNDVDPIVQEMQFFEGLSQHLFFDLDEYMRHLSTDVILYGHFADQLREVVVFSDHTNSFFTAYPLPYGQTIPIHHYSGLTSFVPYEGNASYEAGYQTTEWYGEVFN